MRYIILLQDFDLIITTLIGTLVNNIGDSIIYINLVIDIRNKYKNFNIISNLGTVQYIIIIDKISMIKLKILSNKGN